MAKDFTLEDWFAVIKGGNSKQYLTLDEFTNGTKSVLTEQEAVELFRACDPNKSNNLYQESFI